MILPNTMEMSRVSEQLVLRYTAIQVPVPIFFSRDVVNGNENDEKTDFTDTLSSHPNR